MTLYLTKLYEMLKLQRSKEVVKILFDIVITLAGQDFAFRGNGEDGNFRQFAALVVRYCSSLERWINRKRLRLYNVTYMAPESQNEMIQLPAEDFRQRIVEEIKCANMFGVSADTTPDLFRREQMAVVRRYVNADGDTNERLLSLKITISKKAADTVDEIITTLNSHTLPVLLFH